MLSRASCCITTSNRSTDLILDIFQEPTPPTGRRTPKAPTATRRDCACHRRVYRGDRAAHRGGRRARDLRRARVWSRNLGPRKASARARGHPRGVHISRRGANLRHSEGIKEGLMKRLTGSEEEIVCMMGMVNKAYLQVAMFVFFPSAPLTLLALSDFDSWTHSCVTLPGITLPGPTAHRPLWPSCIPVAQYTISILPRSPRQPLSAPMHGGIKPRAVPG